MRRLHVALAVNALLVLLMLAQLHVRVTHATKPRAAVRRSPAAPASPPAPPAPAAFPIPRIFHQMHASRSKLSPLEELLATRCERVNADFEYRFWDDAAMAAFVQSTYPLNYSWWRNMEPFIKRVDTSRYLVMHHFGGAYADVDVDCIRPVSAVIKDLPSGTAWIGGYPEPFQLMSDAGNAFWPFMVERIYASRDNADAWTSTGPSALNDAAKAYVAARGKAVLMPFVTRDRDPGWLEFLGDNNLSVPWFVDNFKLHNDTRRDGGGVGLGFWPNQVVDPGACAGSKSCDDDSCASRWPHALYAHRCIGSWRG